VNDAFPDRVSHTFAPSEIYIHTNADLALACPPPPQVKAPGTKVESTPQGTAVKAPGTTAVSTPQGTVVTAPGTGVMTNHQTGATSVRAPGTSVEVAPGGATVVHAPFVGAIRVPGNTGRKMLQA
jgi:hypothetical protein